MIDLMPGDFFCTSFQGNLLARLILAGEKFHAKDNQAELSHSGILIDANGTTLEALWTVTSQNIWKAYGDVKLLIGRHDGMTYERYVMGRHKINKKVGSWYPVWKLPLFLFPWITKYLPISAGVCSELTMNFLYHCGLVTTWRGWTPDDVADFIVRDKRVKIIYHQNITSYDPAYLDASGEYNEKTL